MLLLRMLAMILTLFLSENFSYAAHNAGDRPSLDETAMVAIERLRQPNEVTWITDIVSSVRLDQTNAKSDATVIFTNIHLENMYYIRVNREKSINGKIVMELDNLIVYSNIQIRKNFWEFEGGMVHAYGTFFAENGFILTATVHEKPVSTTSRIQTHTKISLKNLEIDTSDTTQLVLTFKPKTVWERILTFLSRLPGKPYLHEEGLKKQLFDQMKKDVATHIEIALNHNESTDTEAEREEEAQTG